MLRLQRRYPHRYNYLSMHTPTIKFRMKLLTHSETFGNGMKFLKIHLSKRGPCCCYLWNFRIRQSCREQAYAGKHIEVICKCIWVLLSMHFVRWPHCIIGVGRLRNVFSVALQWRQTRTFHLMDCLFCSLSRPMSKETIKPHITGHWWGESIVQQWIPLTNGQWRWKRFHFQE